jgi:hypothetical protein
MPTATEPLSIERHRRNFYRHMRPSILPHENCQDCPMLELCPDVLVAYIDPPEGCVFKRFALLRESEGVSAE